MGVLCRSLFWCALFYVLSSFSIILTRTRELVGLLLLSFFACRVTVNLYGAVDCLPFVIVVFPDHTQLLFFVLSPKVLLTTALSK